MLVKNQVKLKDKNVAVTFVPQDSEDLWYLYNLLSKGDIIQVSTTRNVKKGAASQIAKGKSKMEKVNIRLKLLVEDISYIASDDGMRLSGKSMDANEYVPLNSYHTAEVELGKDLTIIKESWDTYDMTVLQNLCDIEKKADIGAIVLEEGVAHLCFVTETMTTLQSKIEKSIPRKNRINGTKDMDKAMQSFFKMITTTMIRNFDFERLKVVLLASPGFVARSLLDYIIDECKKEVSNTTGGNTVYHVILKNQAKFVVAHATTGYLQGLQDVLNDPATRKKLSDTKFSKELEILEQFHQALNDDDDRAWYGEEEVTRAVNMDAVKFLLLSDELFRSDDIETRRKYVDLSDLAKQKGVEVFIFSSLHETGVQLNQLTGVAALLKYPVSDLDDE